MEEKSENVENILHRSVEECIGLSSLEERLSQGKKLRIKMGIDPTSKSIHLGRAVQLLKLRDFQKMGHTIVFIVGDFTGIIGDTSDKESERPMLTKNAVEENMKSYISQVGKILEIEKTEIHYNSVWLEKLTYRDIGEHANIFSLSDFIKRENIKKRIDKGKRVSLREVLYPLMQGYDSVITKADVEIGGTDQRFNLLAGRTLQEHYGLFPQSVILHTLLPGLDGRKMSSSWGNGIFLTDSKEDMYGKIMSMYDSFIIPYFIHCTRVPLSEIENIKKGLEEETIHPKDAKMRLAREIVFLYFSKKDALKAEDGFIRTFSEKLYPEEMQEIIVSKKTPLSKALLRSGIISSLSEWRRLVKGKGVHRYKEKESFLIENEKEELESTEVIRIGKRRFVRFVVER